jgi:hypothetical protein
MGGGKSAFFTQKKAKLWKNLILTLVFEETAIFYRRQIAENCDHNTDPWSRIC